MNQDQLTALLEKTEEGAPDRIYLQVRDYLPNTFGASGDAKTLLYGYDCDRNTHHVFQDYMGFIYLYVYDNHSPKGVEDLKKVDVSGEGILSLEELIPNKRLYPQYCDYDFCAYLKGKGVHLPFTVWAENKMKPSEVFAGEIF